MKELREYIHKHKINYGYIKEETSFSAGHVSRILNGKCPPSERFLRLIVRALQKHARKEIEEFNHFVEEMSWQELL